MAGSVMTFTYDDGQDGVGLHCNLRKVIATWTSDSSAGTVSGASRKVAGRIVKIQTLVGSPAPTSGYSVTITDDNSVNILGNSKQNLSSVAVVGAVETYPLLIDADTTPLSVAAFPVVCSVLNIAIASAGNSKQGTLILFYAPL